MAGLPNLPSGLQPGLKSFLEKLAEKVQVTDADRGSPLQSKPTWQDLVDTGLVNVNQSQALKSNSRSFTLSGSVAQWVTSAIPRYFSDQLNPPVATGLLVTLNASNAVLTWDLWASDYYKQTIVYRSLSNNLSTAINIGSTTGTTYVDELPPSGSVYYYWIRNQSKNDRLSDFNRVLGTTQGNVAGAPVIAYSFSSTDLILSWPTPTSALLIKYYIVKHGATYEGGTIVGTANTNTLRNTVDFGGTRTYWIAPVDINNQVGLAGSVTVIVNAPGGPTIAQTIQNNALVLTYSAPQGSLPVATYEVRHGANWAAGATLTSGTGTRFEQAVNWVGNRTFWVTAYDTAGNAGAATQIIFAPTVPGVVTITTQIIDNNVLLSWTNAIGSLSIGRYEVDRNLTVIGSVSGNFTVVFEAVSATYVYGITPYDSAGNAGTRSIVSATVEQPADYVLYSNVDSTFTGTKTQVIVENSALACCVNDAETWETHFTSRGWTTIDGQIAAGYTGYLVYKTTGSYVETIDYGTTIASTRISVTTTNFASNGTVTTTCQIETSPNGTTWTSYSGFTAVGTSFRHVRYTLNFSAAATGTGLATDTANTRTIKPLNYRLDTRQKTINGMVSAVSTDTGGTVVNIAPHGFLDVVSINVAPLGTTPLYCVYDFVDAPSPTEFKVLVFNSSGVRVSATVSYTISGV